MTIGQTLKMVNPSHNAQSHSHCDVLIIGAGLAGLATALSLPRHLQVTVLAKQDLTDCSSHYAQGGIAAVIDNEDSIDEHVSDTLIAGDGLCDVDATTQILAQGADAIEWLLKHNVPFTTNTPFSTNAHGDTHSGLATNATLTDLHLTKEGGHGRRRVAHADDATGKHIMQALHNQALTASNITIYPFHEALSLLTESLPTEGSRCIGAQVIDTQTNSLIQFNSRAVVLASGGLGQLFSRATAPNVCVGDGIMMAWEAGCRLANLEFIQFHPTGLVYEDENGSSNFLISEAVRGEGGDLRCPISHERFMPAYDKREELAPRDIVARAIANEIANNGLGYVHLDISHKPAQFIKQHFPDIYAQCLSLGIDITKQPIPVAPTAHYTCGGILTNAQGQTDIQGLYAAGEVANTGLHGANRLASNSLLECVVVGRAIASHIPHYIAGASVWNRFGDPKTTDNLTDTNELDKNYQADAKQNRTLESIVPIEVLVAVLTASPSFADSSSIINDYLAPPQNPATITSLTAFNTVSDLKDLMTRYMGINRSAPELNHALQSVLACKQQQATCDSHSTSAISNADVDFDSLRWQRLLTLATLLLQSALAREESRGGHSRHDYPNTAAAAAMSIIPPLSSSMAATLTSPTSTSTSTSLQNLKREQGDAISTLMPNHIETVKTVTDSSPEVTKSTTNPISSLGQTA